MAQPITPLRELLDARLRAVSAGGAGLDAYIATLRTQRRSWRYIAADLEQRTGTRVSWASLRGWYSDPLTIGRAA